MVAQLVTLARASLGGDTAALAALASKVLGYAVVAGASVLKVPQIAAILRARSAKGLSASMFEAEIVGYSVVLAYSLHLGLAFNAYGEVVFMLLQNAILLLLVYRYTPPPVVRTTALWGAYAAAAAAYFGGAVTGEHVVRAYSVSNLIFWYARVPQIMANWRAKSTGALSGASTFLQVAGGAVRVFTTLQEGGGMTMLTGYVIGLALNLIMLLQIIVYGAGTTVKRAAARQQRAAAGPSTARRPRAKQA